MNTATDLSSSEMYPTFNRVIVSDTFNGRAIPQMFRLFGWENCSFLYTDNVFTEGVYLAFLEAAKAERISILNKQEYRKLP
jgi:hypothetical protein